MERTRWILIAAAVVLMTMSLPTASAEHDPASCDWEDEHIKRSLPVFWGIDEHADGPHYTYSKQIDLDAGEVLRTGLVTDFPDHRISVYEETVSDQECKRMTKTSSDTLRYKAPRDNDYYLVIEPTGNEGGDFHYVSAVTSDTPCLPSVSGQTLWPISLHDAGSGGGTSSGVGQDLIDATITC